MFRLFTALPRPHKFLMVPILSMVSVLGVHTYQQHQHRTHELAQNSHQQTTNTASPALSPADDTDNEDGDDDSVADIHFAVDTTAAQLLTALRSTPPIAIDDTSNGITPFHQRFLSALTTGSDADFADELPYDDESLGNQSGLDQEVATEPSDDQLRWLSYTVQPGDSFGSIAAQSMGLNAVKVSNLLNSLPDNTTRRILTQLRIGMSIDYQIDKNNQLAALRVMRTPRDGLLLSHESGNHYTYTNIHRNTEPMQRTYAGTVNGSFGQSAQASGLSSSEVMEITRALSRKLNFRAQAHAGDHFQALVEADTVDGKKLGSRVLAVQYKGASADITLVRYNDSFYTPDGRGLDPSFNRYPFSGQFPVTSPFDLTRLHPVTHHVAPHHGTDFGMPTGTPIKSPSAGVITQVAYNPYAGHYVVIDHGDGLKTRYLHLSRALVRQGERINMGTPIALSGGSGRVTGPHLHYEVLVNNHAVDAMRVKLPNGQQLSGPQLASFKRQAQQFIARLSTPDNDRAYAQNNKAPANTAPKDNQGS